MDWSENGIILGVRKHGETSAIVEVLTEGRGRHLGLVRGGRSRKMQAVLQPGNFVNVVWRARLEDHLGSYLVEPLTLRAAELMASKIGLHGLNTLTALCLLLAEREPHPRLFNLFNAILPVLDAPAHAGPTMIRFELAFLDDLGFGLDLTECAATGTRQDLVYVSPKSGRAVSGQAGAPYHEKLLPLPAGLASETAASEMDSAALRDGFALTGYFLNRHVFGPRGVQGPASRDKLIAALIAEN